MYDVRCRRWGVGGTSKAEDRTDKLLECDSADVISECSLAGEEGVDVEEEGAEVQLPVSVRNDDGDPVPRRAVPGPGPTPW